MGMKPTNNNESCDPISSNCVIWGGPDLPCIKLCKGDTVTAVVYKLAVDLCTIKDMLDISNYDLSCFNLAQCGPKDFQELIQLLIEKICEGTGGSVPTPSPSSGCPDCVVPIASCFYYLNPLGDTVTSMQLTDYAIAIGNKLCGIVGQITTINATLTAFNIRITDLENAPAPTFTLPSITPACVLPEVPTQIDLVLSALELQFCQLRTYTGNPDALLQAMMAACQGLNSSQMMQGQGVMSSIPGWYSTPSSLAQSFSNLWKTVCDLRNAVSFIKLNCCNTGCDAIDLNVEGQSITTNSLRLTFSGIIPATYIDSPMGSSIRITDSVGGGPQVINGVQIKAGYVDTGNQYTIALLGVNAAHNLTVEVTARFLDPSTGTVCESIIQILVLGLDVCPMLVLTSTFDGVGYTFTWSGTTPILLTVQLWDTLETVLLQSSVLNVTTTNPSGSFVGLTEGTTYKLRLLIEGQPCGFSSFTTLVHPCVAPTLLAPDINVDNPTGDTNGRTIAGWQAEYNFYHLS